ncbi:MAG: hypothetical protein OXE78_00295 [Gammaproteobacteria bacterium]|nr:hypothetical protein [Gammaproteobacteria bacterium]
MLIISYLTHIVTFYFILKWIPLLVVDMGYSPASAGSVLVWANVGGAPGSVILGSLTHLFGVRVLVMGAMGSFVLLINVFGQGQSDLTSLAAIAASPDFILTWW